MTLRILTTIPSTIVSEKRSFFVLKRVKNILRVTMCQDRLSSLEVLVVEQKIAKNINFDGFSNDFAKKNPEKEHRGDTLVSHTPLLS